MSEQDEKLMAEYGITSTVKTVYLYNDYRYERLSDALSYARIDARRSGEAVEQETRVSPADLKSTRVSPRVRLHGYARPEAGTFGEEFVIVHKMRPFTGKGQAHHAIVNIDRGRA